MRSMSKHHSTKKYYAEKVYYDQYTLLTQLGHVSPLAAAA
jgi:hypothetical protein